MSRYNVGGVMLDRPFKLRRLGHVGTFQTDMDAAYDFYVGGLGFFHSDDLAFGPNRAGFFTTNNSDHHAFVCIDAAMARGPDSDFDDGITINQISFQVGSLEEVMEGHRFFKENGVHIWRVGRDFPGSNWAFYGRDPDGFLVELFYGMEQIGWDRRSKPEAMRHILSEEPALPQSSEADEIRTAQGEDIDLASGLCGLAPEPATYNVGGVLSPRPFSINKVGPVHLFVRDMDVSVEFYTRVVGLTVTEEVIWKGHRAVFLRNGSDHHVIGLFPLALRDELGFPTNTRVMHLSLEISSYRQLQDACAFMSARGAVAGPKMPRELLPGLDHTRSFLDPEGHAILLYFSMEQVGWDGRPRPWSERRAIPDEWPETLEAASDTYTDQVRQGPIA